MKKVEHRFFEKYLDNDLQKLTEYLDNKYNEMKETEWINKDRFYDPGNHWNTFNVFNFDSKEISDLKEEIKKMTIEACSYYDINFEEQKYYIHGWFNYYPTKVNESVEPENLTYHDHGDLPHWLHGYYCVNAEPSTTYYKINDKRFDNINKNNRAVLSINGFPHSPGPWQENTNRITIGYNLRPAKDLHPSDAQFILL
jgi:hypothetical protein